MTKVLKLALMGRLQLSQGETPLTDLVPAKAQALLCYLAMSDRPHSRQALAGLLWGELAESDARRNLRGALMKLRHVIEPYLVISHQTLAFNHKREYWLDVEVFQAKLSQPGRQKPGPEQVREAVALYRGDFLEDFHLRQAPAFEEWMMGQRVRLRESALDACHALAVHYTEQGEYATGIEYARYLLDLEPTREDGHRQLMTLLALSGQRSAALSQYETCCAILQAELSVAPSAETTTLYEQIRRGEVSRVGEQEQAWGRQEVVPIFNTVVSRSVVPHPSLTSRSSSTAISPINEPPPFIAGPPVTHPSRFFGRERELKRLFNLLKHLPLQNAAIIGPRRSGKTSLLHYLKDITTTAGNRLRPGQRTDWLPEPERYRWIFVDFQDPRLGGREPLLRYLLAHMGLLLSDDACDLETFLNLVSSNLQMPAVILFDEIGVALERYPELDDTFWESLRSLATNQVDGNLAFVLASSEPPEQLARYNGLGSPFFNIFGYTATLGPLTESEAHELIASSPVPFPEADVAWILAESGRWPILLQILCRERLLTLEEDNLEDERELNTWREDALRQIAPFLTLKDEA